MVKAEYDVQLQSADNGMIVRVGCKVLVVTEDRIGEALVDIKRLLTGGHEGQKEVRKKWLNDMEEVTATERCEVPPACTHGIPTPIHC
jgi:hypothetical protein